MELLASSSSTPTISSSPLLTTIRPNSNFIGIKRNVPTSQHRTQFIPSLGRCSTSFTGNTANFTSENHVLRSPLRKGRSVNVTTAIFERFTERAIKVVTFSQKEAKSLGKDMVFTQHLLLGLIAEEEDSSRRGGGEGYLGSGVKIDKAREAVRSIWSDARGDENENSGFSPTTHVPFSISTKRVFEAAVEYSKTMGHNFISPDHISIGLLTVDDGSAGRVFMRLGVNVNQLADMAVSRLQRELAKDGREPSVSPKGTNEKSGSAKATSVKSSEKTKEKTALGQFCVDLSARASDGRIDSVIGRDTEIHRIIQILCRKSKNNPILIGESGVGKTAIAEGLAIRIAQADVPPYLMTKRIMSLDIGLLMAGAKERGELETRVTMLLKEVAESGNVILFIDEVHTLVGSGVAGKGNKGTGLDIANLLKPALGRGQLQCIASTTISEHRMHFENDKALARRFQPVLIKEPSQKDAVRMLLGLQEKYELHHKCQFTLEAINAAVYLSARYIPDRYLPDKAIDLIDEAGSKARMEGFKRKKEQQICILSKSPDEYWQEIRAVQDLHEVMLASKFKREDGASDMQKNRGLNLQHFLPSAEAYEEPTVVGPDEIAAVASVWSGIPVQQLTADERHVLVGLDEMLRKRVVGQEEAVAAISRAVKRSRVGLKDPKRPMAVMLFCGPTGVGKTELTKALAACYFGSESAMLRLDMSEYMERHTVSKLIGSPPGYVGYGEGGMLTEAIRRRPFTVVLFDEIEKAHPDVFNILLQLFEDGHLTDSQGRRVSFKNALVVMTSNIGSTAIAKGRHSSFGFFAEDDATTSNEGMKSLVMEELKNYLRPEFLNRIDEVVVFHPLEKTQMLEILNIMLQEVKERLVTFGVSLEVSKATKDLICEQGYSHSYGARHLRRAVTHIVEDLLSEALLTGKYNRGDNIIIDLDSSGKQFVTNGTDQSVYYSDSNYLM